MFWTSFLSWLKSRKESRSVADQPLVSGAAPPGTVVVMAAPKKKSLLAKTMMAVMAAVLVFGLYEHSWTPWKNLLHSPLPKSVTVVSPDGKIIKMLHNSSDLRVQKVDYQENFTVCEQWCKSKAKNLAYKEVRYHAQGHVNVVVTLGKIKSNTDMTTKVTTITLPQPKVDDVVMNFLLSKKLSSNCGISDRLRATFSLIWGHVGSCDIPENQLNQIAQKQFSGDANIDEHIFNEARTQAKKVALQIVQGPNGPAQGYTVAFKWDGKDAPTKAADAGKKFVQGVLSGK